MLALAVVVGDHRFQGPVLLPVTREHGLHLGDAVVVAAWAVCVLLLALLARPTRRPSKTRYPGADSSAREARTTRSP